MTIKIGAIPFSVSLTDGFAEDDANNVCCGQVEHDAAKISIRRIMPVEQRRATLWHEILHAMFNQMGLNGTKQEERIVTALGYGIAALLDDNSLADLYAHVEDNQ